MIDLGTLGGSDSQAHGINQRGQVVGVSTTSAGVGHAFLWEKGTMVDLGTLGGNFSQAMGINVQGLIVGGSETSIGFVHAAVLDDQMILSSGSCPTF